MEISQINLTTVWQAPSSLLLALTGVCFSIWLSHNFTCSGKWKLKQINSKSKQINRGRKLPRLLLWHGWWRNRKISVNWIRNNVEADDLRNVDCSLSRHLDRLKRTSSIFRVAPLEIKSESRAENRVDYVDQNNLAVGFELLQRRKRWENKETRWEIEAVVIKLVDTSVIVIYTLRDLFRQDKIQLILLN